MHQNRFGWGSAPDPAVGAYSSPPDPLAGLKGAWRCKPGDFNAGSISRLAVQAWRLQHRQYFTLLRQKRSCFWTAHVSADQQNPHRLWQSLDQLMGRGRAPPSDMNASVHHTFFDDKIAGVSAATAAGAAEPTFTAAPIGCELRLFTPVTLSPR